MNTVVKAVCIEDVAGHPELFVRNVPDPVPGPEELLVRVQAAAVNFADLYRWVSHYGHHRAEGGAVAGLEMAGEVLALGNEVHGFSAGDRVMAMASGAYAELCTVDYRLAMRAPADFSWAEAAASPVALMTAHDALITNGRLQPSETVLIEAVTSSIGLAAVKIAKHHGVQLVIGTSGSPEKLERMMGLGLDVGINYKQEDVPSKVHEATGGHGADVIIGNAGGETLGDLVKAAAIRGRIINVGRLGKWTGEIDLDEHSRKRIALIGVTFRTRSVDECAEIVRRTEEDLAALMESGEMRPVIDRTFPLEEAAAAQDYLRSGQHFGKVVLMI